jgi:predicted nucleic acid-binding Zn ribbon protein
VSGPPATTFFAGSTIGKWTIVERHIHGLALARCECGTLLEVNVHHIASRAARGLPVGCRRCSHKRALKPRLCRMCYTSDPKAFGSTLTTACIACDRRAYRNGLCPAGCGRAAFRSRPCLCGVSQPGVKIVRQFEPRANGCDVCGAPIPPGRSSKCSDKCQITFAHRREVARRHGLETPLPPSRKRVPGVDGIRKSIPVRFLRSRLKSLSNRVLELEAELAKLRARESDQ